MDLSLIDSELNILDFENLSEAFKYDSRLKKISIIGDNIRDDNIEKICSLLNSNINITNLGLYNIITISGIKIICSYLKFKMCQIVKFDMSLFYLGEEGVKELAMALRENTSIRSLSIELNDIYLSSFRQIISFLKFNPYITEFVFYDNYDEDGEHIEEADEIRKKLDKILERNKQNTKIKSKSLFSLLLNNYILV